MKNRLFNLLVLTVFAFSGLAARPNSAASQGLPPGGEPVSAASLTGGQPIDASRMLALMPYLSGDAAMVTAMKFGATDLWGKKLSVSAKAGADSLVSGASYSSENEPSIAVNPTNGSYVVEVNHYYNNSGGSVSCYAQASYDGGSTFHFDDDVYLPLLDAGDCSDPIVRYSPDGALVYYGYMDVAPGGTTSRFLLSRANATTPTTLIAGGPYVVMDSFGGFVDKPWLDVAPYDAANAGHVYFSATYFSSFGDCAIGAVSSSSYGGAGSFDDAGTAGNFWLVEGLSESCATTNQGSRPLGLSGVYTGQEILCWYNSETDGFLTGIFDIRCKVNANFGLHSDWGSTFTAVNNMHNEAPFFLGPSSSYERWWTAMFPALSTDPEGMVYIGFTADPTANHNDVESGNVYLARNFPVATGWLAPIKVGSNPSTKPQYAQGFAALSARYDARTNKYIVYESYMDHSANNKFYNVVYRRGVRAPGSKTVSFGKVIKITDLASFSDFSFLGDYIDSAVNQRRYLVAWTDRSDVLSKTDPDDDTMVDWFTP